MSDVYKNLELSMLSIADYKDIPVIDNCEPLVPITDTMSLTAKQRGQDMIEYTGDVVYVRKGTRDRLSRAADLLIATDDSMELNVVYGYRALQVQTKRFETIRQSLSDQFGDEELDIETHRRVARPDVAGHPTGGAVDIQILQEGQTMNFGTGISEFIPDAYTFSPFVGREAMQNRMLLRTVMMGAGFASFDGEWWHFSYGDKEWARFMKQPNAVYTQLDFHPDMLSVTA